jgi:hypothetical protein
MSSRAGGGSAQARQAADHQVGAHEQHDGRQDLPRVALKPVLGVLQLRLGTRRPDHQEHEGMMTTFRDTLTVTGRLRQAHPEGCQRVVRPGLLGSQRLW